MVAKLVPISALTMKTVVFPKTLGAMTVLGAVNEGTANRYIGYAYPNGSDPVTATATLNGGPGDVDEQVDSFFENVNSYDGGRYKCGHDTMGSSYSCVARIAGSGQITLSTTGVSTNEQMAKYMAEFLDWQK